MSDRDLKRFESTKTLGPNESILVNNNLGFTIIYKHDTPHLSVIDSSFAISKTDHLDSTTFNPFIIGNLKVATGFDADNKAQIRLDSEAKITCVLYSYPQDFIKLFEYRRRQEDIIPHKD